jgi:TonB family protein
MTGSKLFLARMNGWALSLALHGGVAFVAALSVIGVNASGGSGSSAGGIPGSGMTTPSFAATLRDADEQVVSGTPLGDPPQYGRLNPEETTLEPVSEALPEPKTPFDIFSVGSSDSTPTPQTPSLLLPPTSRPGSFEGRATKLPAASADGNDASEGSSGTGGSGGDGEAGNSSGNATGDGDGNATGLYTPAPSYPSEARRRNIEGTVLVELLIQADGSCAVRKVVESSGFAPLDDAVQSTVNHWKYRPADADGRSESLTKRIRFVFKLGR